MAKRESEFIYWDSNVIQSYIEKRAGRWQLLRSLLRASADIAQPIKLVTSTWTVAEVAYFGALESDHALPEAYEAIQDFWESDVIELIELHELIALKAKDIVRQSHFDQYTIKPKDAVHAASAIFRGVVEFHTYDMQFAARLREHYGLSAGPPTSLRIRTGNLPKVVRAEQGVLGLSRAAALFPPVEVVQEPTLPRPDETATE